ncbi:MAG TPA: ABC transporter permease [Acidimicrobiales bacterium]|nr:ABC transporter permease [Acidimicrobiales bacterium]
MSHLLIYIIPGISDGAVYAIAALGLVLTYKTSGVFNFAHGAVIGAAAYLFYQFRDRQHMPWPVAAVLTLICVGIIGGLLLERLAYYLADAPTVMRVVATVGLLVGIDTLFTAIYGAQTLQFAPYLPQGGPEIAGVQVSAADFIITALALAGTAGLYLFFRRAKLGVAMQAVVDDPSLLSLQGTSPIAVRRLAWTLGASFAAISGMLFAPEIGIDVNDMTILAIAAFSAAAIGLFKSLPLTFLGAMVIGVGTSLLGDALQNVRNITIESIPPNLPFLLLFAVMLFVPRGKLVEQGIGRVRGFKPLRRYGPRIMLPIVALALAVGILIPNLVGAAYLNQYTTGLAYAVIFGSLALLLWTSGQISLCQLAFAAVGASTFAHALSSGMPWLVALLFAGLITVPLGVLVAIPAFRLSGIYLAIATFAFGIMLERLFYTTFLMFGSSDALELPRPRIFGLNLTSDKAYYYTVLVVVVLCCAVIVLVGRSRLGRLLRGLGDSPAALEAHGGNTKVTRLFVFCISAFLAGIGGALIVGVTQSASGTSGGTFDFTGSLFLLAVLAFCGRRPILSPFIAAFVYQVTKIYPFFRDPNVVKWEGVVFGALAIGVAIVPAITVPIRGRASLRRSQQAMTGIGLLPMPEFSA